MKRVRLTLDVSVGLNAQLEAMAEAMDCSKSEVLRRAIALMEVGVDAKAAGQTMGLFNSEGQLTTRIVGI